MDSNCGIFFSRKRRPTTFRERMYHLLCPQREWMHCGVWVRPDKETFVCSLTTAGLEIVPVAWMNEDYELALMHEPVDLCRLVKNNHTLQLTKGRVLISDCFKKYFRLPPSGWLCTDYVQSALGQDIEHLHPDELYFRLCKTGTPRLSAGNNARNA